MVKTNTEARADRIRQFAESEVFERLFLEGMSLVEETATYLDGPGREESRELNREDSLNYATLSMETTTRLMQAASWLVVQRAVREGDMEVAEAEDEKFRLSDDRPLKAREGSTLDTLPEGLLALVRRSSELYARICRIDEKVYGAGEDAQTSPVRNQIDALQQAANRGAFDPLSVWRRGG